MIKIEITDPGVVAVFNRLTAFGENPGGTLRAIGEVLLGFTRERFEQSADPYGTPWEPNSRVTLETLLRNKSGVYAKFSHLDSRKEGWSRVGDKKGYFKKDGTLTKRSQNLMMGKKPLIGESKSLSTQFSYRVLGNDTVVVTSLMAYAAMQNFGGSKAMFPHLWGDIPARPFFPDEGKDLPFELSQEIAEVLREAIKNTMGG